MTNSVKEGTAEACMKMFAEASRFNCVSNGANGELRRTIYGPRNQICKLLGISVETGPEWFVKGRVPTGINLLKLSLLLELLGYVIHERAMIPVIQRKLANHVALTAVDVTEIADTAKVNSGTVLRWLHGSTIAPEAVQVVLKTILDKHQHEADAKLLHWEQTLQALGLKEKKQPAVSTPAVPVPVTVPVQVCDTKNKPYEPVLEALAVLIKAAIPLAEQVSSDQYSAADRNWLRENTRSGPSHGVFILSNLLNGLCGERALRENKSK